MSILQKILDDMYIEPSLLEKLTDVQKQILFCKMREEQIRRWNLRENEKNSRKSSDTRVKWLLGKDGQPWVWVMGEHPNDKSIDEILEEETKQKARQLAAIEASRSSDAILPDSIEDQVEVPNQVGQPSQDELQRREAEIYQSLKKAREEANREAEVEAEIEAPHSLIFHIRIFVFRATSARSIKPHSRLSVIQWYRNEEYIRGVGVDRITNHFAPWFHGLIDREEAELLLKFQPVGSFLVRLSDRILGYVISCQAALKVKHFLVERTEEGYQFFGSEQMVHADLSDLVAFHKKVPITQTGLELLLIPVGQQRIPPDYAELLPNTFD
ncbi:unnamed protein product [Soboliphyme baturini]|uniref:SH2 domain-containing protein n=1 Tax=Soboliphyme baturini TaxID=241478 RepID=A0A183IHE2_9BILA|nr:unnamed protein product [Soboliphyme baturini]